MLNFAIAFIFRPKRICVIAINEYSYVNEFSECTMSASGRIWGSEFQWVLVWFNECQSVVCGSALFKFAVAEGIKSVVTSWWRCRA